MCQALTGRIQTNVPGPYRPDSSKCARPLQAGFKQMCQALTGWVKPKIYVDGGKTPLHAASRTLPMVDLESRLRKRSALIFPQFCSPLTKLTSIPISRPDLSLLASLSLSWRSRGQTAAPPGSRPLPVGLTLSWGSVLVAVIRKLLPV